MIGFSATGYVVAGVVAIGIIGGGLTAAYFKGRADYRAELLEDTLKAHETRDEIDAKIDELDRRDLCIRLGGLPDECDELRGVEETAPGE